MENTDQKQEIMRGAEIAFAEKGLKFTMADVAAAVHISKKTIYSTFESKDELLSAIAVYSFDKIAEAKQAVMEEDIPPAEKLPKLMTAMPEELKMLDFRALGGLQDKYPQAASIVRERLIAGWEPVYKLLREGAEQGVFRPVNETILRITFTAAIESFLGSTKEGGSAETLQAEGISYNDALEGLMDLLFYGIARQDPSNES